ncbi:nucleolar domain family protein [Clavispora lusitaniae]|uniref:nucleolar domain family protein n=1 Tax=Clavispora lusitaniae TaxID=36911 RepID=UPI00202C9A18|nr:nucleolar domain family protein [Clavispora lusitaniae]
MGKSGKKSGASKQDPRFASASYDPRFILPSLKKNKIKVDERFSKEELAKLNVTATGKKVKVDRYGRKLKEKDEVYDKYFEEEKESEAEEEEKATTDSQNDGESESGSEADSESGSDSESEESQDDEMPQVVKKKVEPEVSDDSEEEESDAETFVDRARGEGLQSDSSDDSDSDSDSDSFNLDSDVEIEEEKPEEGDPSDTFAVVNLDWDNVRAVDLMATFASFVPKGGLIKSVTIYPSEYGKQQMQKEEIEGPPKDLFKKKKQVESDSDSDEELDLKNQEDLEKAARKLYEEDDGEEDYDSKALRRYQLQRLRYYYAVVRCDSISTAKNIYDNCDGSEYESTANIFDLRYVPEGMEFDDSEAKDVCTKIPSSYRPDSTFVTDALQHSKVKLTWDETPKERMTLASRSFSQKEIDDMDFKAYLASDSDGSEAEQASSLKDKYKNLLGGKFSFDKGADDEEDDVDMEITFTPGLDQNKPPEPEKGPEEESTIDAYKRKEKERRARRMEKFKNKEAEENENKEKEKETKKSKKGKKGKKLDEQDEKSKAELELLMLDENNDDENNAEHFSMRDIVKAEKQKNRKNKKGKKNYDNELVQNDFQADLNDPRFREVFESHEYAIDPTSSEFKKTDTMKTILKERSKRSRKDEKHEEKKHKKQKKSEEPSMPSLNSLVEKLKGKSKH